MTFVGSGEPTLHASIGWLIAQVKRVTSLGVIHADPAIAMAWLTGTTLESKQSQEEIRAVIHELERAIVS